MATTKTKTIVAASGTAALLAGAALVHMLSTGTGYVAPANVQPKWCHSGNPTYPAQCPFLSHIAFDVPYTGGDTLFARYCPDHDCLHGLNGAYIWQGDVNGEVGGASLAIAAEALECHYGKKSTDQENTDFVIANFGGKNGQQYLGSPWGDGCGEAPATSPTPKPTATTTPPLCNDHGVFVPCPTPTPKPTPTVAPTPTPAPTPVTTCAPGKKIAVPPLCEQVVNRLAGKSDKTVSWGVGPQSNIKQCQVLFSQLKKGIGAWVVADNTSSGLTVQCIDVKP